MAFPITVLRPDAYPASLHELPEPPERLYLRGCSPDLSRHLVAFVGARSHTEYGERVCNEIIAGLAGHPVTIVSGLAIGIDGIAHAAALEHGLPTIAVVGSGLDDSVLYPAANRPLAHRILEHDGTLISELPADERGTKHTFPARNRIIAGLAELVIAVECTERSGTRITTRLAVEYNKEVGAVPHSVFSETGAGANALLHQGAHVIRHADDVLAVLGAG